MTDYEGTTDPRELLAEYALGVLGEAESAAVGALLERDPDAAVEYEEMARVARLLPMAAQEMTPGEHVRVGLLERIQAEARHEPIAFRPRPTTNRARILGIAAAAAAIFVLVGVGGFALGRGAGNDSSLDGKLARQSSLVEAAARGTLGVTRAEDGPRKMAVAYAPGSAEAFVYVEGLGAPPEGKAFQAWFTRDGRTFEPSSVFSVRDGGVWIEAKAQVSDYAAIGFTVEDAKGVDAPTQAPFMTLPLAARASAFR